jgi:short subunit dehydrogenase-like uncharacterized protein
MTAPASRELDIVLFGATGFVGRLTAAYLADHAPDGVRVGLAGRSLARLETVRAGLGERAADWPLLVVDASDEAAVTDLAGRTGVVATTVGPYAAYGKPLAGACARAGTHYADLTGEVLFARWSIDANDEAARASGARIVHSCGFDSIPSDLGVLLTARRAAEDDAGTLGETTLFVRSMKGGFSGGTIDSLRRQALETGASADARRVVGDSYALSPARSEEPPSRNRSTAPPGPLDRVLGLLPVGRAESGRFTAPFVMAAYNTRVVRRSNALTGWSYGREFRYREVSDTGAGVTGAVGAAALAAGLGAVAGGMMFAPTRAVLDRVLPKPGEGPSEEAMAGGRFVMHIEAATTTGVRYRTRVAADKDPGYSGTAVMLGESALALALDGPDLPPGAGVLTPATGIGMPLVARLRAQGFTLETERR